MTLAAPRTIFKKCIVLAALVGLNKHVIPSVNAYPTGAGSCKGGSAGMASSEGKHAAEGNGALSEINLSVELNGQSLDPNESTLYMLGSGKKLELKDGNSAGSGFKGFLLRLSSSTGIDVSKKLGVTDTTKSQLLVSTGEQNGTPASCEVKVAGVTHTNNKGKSEVLVTFDVDQADDLVLDVTVVKSNPPKSNWYHSQYKIKVVNPPTANPTSSPSIIPSTIPSDRPTSVPTVSSGPSTSNAPSNAPVTNPVTAKPTEAKPESSTYIFHGTVSLIGVAGFFLLL